MKLTLYVFLIQSSLWSVQAYFQPKAAMKINSRFNNLFTGEFLNKMKNNDKNSAIFKERGKIKRLKNSNLENYFDFIFKERHNDHFGKISLCNSKEKCEYEVENYIKDFYGNDKKVGKQAIKNKPFNWG